MVGLKRTSHLTEAAPEADCEEFFMNVKSHDRGPNRDGEELGEFIVY